MSILQYGFMQRAFLVGILLAVITPCIGITIVLKRMSMIGDALSHSSLAGVVLGLILGVNPVAGAVVMCIVAALGIEAIRKKIPRYSEVAISIVMSAGIGLAGVLSGFVENGASLNYIDESEVLSPADNVYHIDKTQFDVPFVCGAKNLGEALRRIAEGATMIRTKGEPGTGDVVQAVTHMRMMQSEIRRLVSMSEDELYEAAKQLQAPYDLVKYVHENGKLPVVNFAAGGVATPADAALMMQLGAEGVFVGSGIFKSGNPAKRAQAIVKAVTNYNDPKMLAELSEDLGEAMVGINEQEIALLMAERGK